MVKNINKRAQSAVEFLMVYGWMLLIVLIVGALIFSFIDTSSLLPNKLDFVSLFRGDAVGSIALTTDGVIGNDQGKVYLVFSNIAGRKLTLNASEAIIKTDAETYCQGVMAKNIQTKREDKHSLTVLNGESLTLAFDCDFAPKGKKAHTILAGDSLEGEVKFSAEDPKTGLKIPVQGKLRIRVIS